MSRSKKHQCHRRRFLQIGLGSSALLALKAQASPLSFLSAGGSGDDYRALVCVFLYGGADTANLIVPTSTNEYNIYAQSRRDLAEPLDSLLPIQPGHSDGATYGVHSQVPEIQQMFQAGKIAFVPNVGPLVAPTTKTDIQSGNAILPRFLFSHNDQQLQWQTAHADGPGRTGWCGRVADFLSGMNGSSPLSTTISLGGPVPMLVGETTAPFSLGVEGTEGVEALLESEERARVFEKLSRQAQGPLGKAVSDVQSEAMEIDRLISQSLPDAPNFEGLFPGESWLGLQLRTVAQMIAIRSQLGMKRQVFFVGAGDYDTHDDQTVLLPRLYRDLSQSLDGFQRAVEQVGIADRVTTFTSTEFGRTLSSNGKGSDHGWGGHALAMGGPVRGGEIYGRMPDLTLEGSDDFGEGRLIPSIAVDQYAATLSRWFGADEGTLGRVFPNLSNFGSSNLGFLA